MRYAPTSSLIPRPYHGAGPFPERVSPFLSSRRFLTRSGREIAPGVALSRRVVRPETDQARRGDGSKGGGAGAGEAEPRPPLKGRRPTDGAGCQVSIGADVVAGKPNGRIRNLVPGRSETAIEVSKHLFRAIWARCPKTVQV